MASRAGETLTDSATTAAHGLQSSGARMGSALQQNLADLFERQPLVLGAVGLAIGAGIAASIPTTEVEQKLMGEASEQLQEKISETAGEAKDMANAALEEAKAQGFTPKAAGDALRSVGNKLTNAG